MAVMGGTWEIFAPNPRRKPRRKKKRKPVSSKIISSKKSERGGGMTDMYRTVYHKTKLEPIGCVDLVESPDDGGWYAQEYDFTRKDNATRTSRRIYATREALVHALNTGKHLWKSWD